MAAVTFPEGSTLRSLKASRVLTTTTTHAHAGATHNHSVHLGDGKNCGPSSRKLFAYSENFGAFVKTAATTSGQAWKQVFQKVSSKCKDSQKSTAPVHTEVQLAEARATQCSHGSRCISDRFDTKCKSIVLSSAVLRILSTKIFFSLAHSFKFQAKGRVCIQAHKKFFLQDVHFWNMRRPWMLYFWQVFRLHSKHVSKYCFAKAFFNCI